MTWTRLDDQWDQSEKLIRADDAIGSDSASLMWAKAVTYCNRTLSDGRIHGATLRTLVRHKKPQKVIDALVVTGALKKTGDDTFEVHDFLDWNDSRATVEERRAKKQTAGSKGGKLSGESRRAKESESKPPDTDKQRASKTEAPASPPLQESLPSGSEKTNPSPSPSPLPDPEEKKILEPKIPLPQPETARAPGASWGGDPSVARFRTETPHSHAGTEILAVLTQSEKLKGLANREFAERMARFTKDGAAMPSESKLQWALTTLREIDANAADREAANDPIHNLAGFVSRRLESGPRPNGRPGSVQPKGGRDARGGLQPFIEPGTWNPGGDQ